MFEEKLKRMLGSFNIDEAEKLSLEIHQAELNGYEISYAEDRLWEKLTAKVLRGYEVAK